MVKLKLWQQKQSNILDLHSSDITDEIANIIALELSKDPISDTQEKLTATGTYYHLEELNISCNKLTASGVLKVIKTISNSIKVLNISSNLINDASDEEIEDLGSVLAQCHTLQVLDISKNSLTFNNLLKIVQALRGHCSLETLYMNGNINNSVISECEFLVDVILSVNHLLKTVIVCDNKNIRPRFNKNFLPPLSDCKNSSRFKLQNFLLFTKKLCQTVQLPKSISAKETCPLLDKNIISYYVDHKGGIFYNQNLDFAIIVPPDAVVEGDCVEIQANASWFGLCNIQDKCHYYKVPDGYSPISIFYWFSANYTFKIPVYLIMSHYAIITELKDIQNMHLLQGCTDDAVVNAGKPVEMKEVKKGVYFDRDIGYCIYATKHFCSVCMEQNENSISESFASMVYTYETQGKFFADVCFCPEIPNCKEVHNYVEFVKLQ